MDPELLKLLMKRRRVVGQYAYHSRLDGDPVQRAALRGELTEIKKQIEALVASGAAK